MIPVQFCVGGHCRGPVPEDAANADLSRQDVEQLERVALARDRGSDGLIVELVGRSRRENPGSHEGPRDDLEAHRLGVFRVLGWDYPFASVDGDEGEGRRPNDVDALLLIADQVGKAWKLGHHVRVVQVHGLPAEFWLLFDPIQNVALIERLREHARW